MTIITLKLNPCSCHYAHRTGFLGVKRRTYPGWVTNPSHKLITKYGWFNWDYVDKMHCLSAEHTTSSDHNADWTSDIAVTGLTHMPTEPYDNYTESRDMIWSKKRRYCLIIVNTPEKEIQLHQVMGDLFITQILPIMLSLWWYLMMIFERDDWKCQRF